MSCPSFAYPGGKHYQRRWIISHFPREVGRYCEPFAGRGNVFWLACREIAAGGWWLNDLHQVRFFEALKSRTAAELAAAVGDHYPGRDEYAELCRSESLRAVLCEPWITFSGGGWSQGYRHGPKAPTRDGYLGRLLTAAADLKRLDVKLTALDYRDVIPALDESDFAYVDPPYFGCDVRSYRSNDVNHRELVDCLLAARCRWLLSEYERPFYNDAFGPPLATKVETLKVSGKLVAAARRVEALYGPPAH